VTGPPFAWAIIWSTISQATAKAERSSSNTSARLDGNLAIIWKIPSRQGLPEEFPVAIPCSVFAEGPPGRKTFASSSRCGSPMRRGMSRLARDSRRHVRVSFMNGRDPPSVRCDLRLDELVDDSPFRVS